MQNSIHFPRLRRRTGRKISLLTLALSITCYASFSFAAPWDLDPAFGTGGRVIWSPNGNTVSLQGSAMALQTDGKIVRAGTVLPIGQGSFVVARFTAEGALDPTFAGGGFGIQFGGSTAVATSVAIQADGKILVAGYANIGTHVFVVARVNPDGQLDGTFDGDGRVTVGFPSGGGGGNLHSFLNSVAVAPDGKIVLVGSTQGSGTGSFHRTIARLNPNGSLDTSFDGDGRLLDGNGTGGWREVIPQADGSMTLISTATTQFSWWTSVTKVSSSGSEMWASINSGDLGCYGSLHDIAKQPDGKFVVVGSKDCKPIAYRINADGTFDNTFDNTPYNEIGWLAAVAVQGDGKILANFNFGSDGTQSFSLGRYNNNGTLDQTFATGGIVRTSAGIGNVERGGSLIIQPDGKVLVGGYVRTGNENYKWVMVRYQGSSAVPGEANFDYDGDGKSDISVFRPSENKWYILRSSDFGVTQQVFAIPGDVPVPADYDGDDRTDIAIFRPSSGMWWYLSSETGAFIAAQWGQAGDVPRPGDFDGDGRADYIIFRPSDNFWYRASGADGTTSNVVFGAAGDKPVLGDFDGDGKFDPAIFRPSSGDWWYRSSVNGAQLASHWGLAEDIPAAADFDGDGRTDFAVFRPSTGIWYIVNSSNGSYTVVGFGITEDRPVPADYDGDGKADIAVFRPSSGLWYLLRSTSGFVVANWGLATDIPTENAFVP